MGIKGLASYITDNFRDWRDIELSDCQIVLDGNSLPFRLAKDRDLVDWMYGGQYPALKQAMENFFDSLCQKKILPIHMVFRQIDLKEEKLDTLLERKQVQLDEIKKFFDNGEPIDELILPPQVTETYRKVLEDYKGRGVVKIYSAEGDANHVAVSLTNQLNCYLVGDNSDFFIYPLQMGYIPLSEFEWSRPGAPIKCRAYNREAFIASLGIQPDLILAIPAIAGNNTIPNLVKETSLKNVVRDNRCYHAGKDTVKTIEFLRCRGNTMKELESICLSLENGPETLARFCQNFEKAREKYENIQPFNEAEFRITCTYKTRSGSAVPVWLVEQYKDFKLSNNLLEVIVKGKYFTRVNPDDFTKPTSALFSRSIRQEVYSMVDQGQVVLEVIRKGDKLHEDQVFPIPTTMRIHGMDSQLIPAKREKIFNILGCHERTLSSLDEEWRLVVASVCFWVKNAHIQVDDIHLKALLLCFVECYHHGVGIDKYQPMFDIATLHLYTQWQCTYKDSLMLNQVMGLPLPYLSPGVIFDGKRVTYYSQQSQREFESLLTKCSKESRSLFEKIVVIIIMNQNI